MNVYASGHTAKSPALALALALPAMLTVELLRQPETLGDVAVDNNPLVALADVGPALAGKPIALNASGSFDPARGGGGDLTYAWDFGDGAKADGATTSHTYTAPGTYSITLTVRSPSGTRQVHKTLIRRRERAILPNPHDGNPPVAIPRPTPTCISLRRSRD